MIKAAPAPTRSPHGRGLRGGPGIPPAQSGAKGATDDRLTRLAGYITGLKRPRAAEPFAPTWRMSGDPGNTRADHGPCGSVRRSFRSASTVATRRSIRQSMATSCQLCAWIVCWGRRGAAAGQPRPRTLVQTAQRHQRAFTPPPRRVRRRRATLLLALQPTWSIPRPLREPMPSAAPAPACQRQLCTPHIAHRAQPPQPNQPQL